LGLAFFFLLGGSLAVYFYRKSADRAKEVEDLSQKLQRSAKLLEAIEAEARSFFEDDSASRFVLDVDGRILRWNRSLEGFLGLPPDQIGSVQAATLIAGFSFEEIRDSDPGSTVQCEVQVEVPGSGQHVGLLSVTRVERNGDTEFHASIADLTQRRELETQLLRTQKMETVGRLAGGVAHDVNNMLGVILGNADLIQAEGPFPGTVDEDLDEIRQAALRSSRLTRQLLTMARRDVANPAVLDLNKVVREMAPLFRRVIGADIELVTLLQDEAPSIRIDLAQMEQVLLNLLVNAAEAMPDGGKAVIEVTREAGEGLEPDRACIKVRDSGSGMDEGTLSRVFDPFFSTKEGGTGLGLSTVYGVVTRSGGTVSASSSPGEGSTFELSFPAAQVEHVGEVGADAPAALSGLDHTILLAEDESALRSLAQKVFQRAGCRVVEAENGEEALRLFSEDPSRFDALVTDIVMPILGGWELAERVREIRSDLPIVFISGYADRESIRHRLRSESDVFLQKPFRPEELVHAMTLALKLGVDR
jgi:PAS domain S-box-containing protein